MYSKQIQEHSSYFQVSIIVQPAFLPLGSYPAGAGLAHFVFEFVIRSLDTILRPMSNYCDFFDTVNTQHTASQNWQLSSQVYWYIARSQWNSNIQKFLQGTVKPREKTTGAIWSFPRLSLSLWLSLTLPYRNTLRGATFVDVVHANVNGQRQRLLLQNYWK